MKFLFLFLFCVQMAYAAEPLRIFIRSGEKTHRPGCHDYPAFLADWTKLLNERGAKVSGGNDFPTKAQLAETDVVILHSSESGNITGEERANFEAYLKRGGGVVAIHGGSVSRDPDWYKSVIGGSWNFDHTKFLEGHMSLYFTDRENPITKGISNFDLEDEIYYDMDMLPEAKILAAAYTPKPKDGISKPGQSVNVYDIQPQMWTYETDNRRAFVCIPGHQYVNFSHKSIEAVLLRGIAWAGKMKDTDALLSKEKGLDETLRYSVGGPTKPEEAAAKIEVHPEFDISLVAAEPLINKALNIDWDEKGRMWVVESPEYPNGLRKVNTDIWKDSGSVERGNYDRDPLDRISILTDSDGDGRMDKKQVFADKLELATSFVLHKNGVIVSAAPDIWFLEDTDGDEVADKRTKLYTGLGTGDTHAVMNNLRWGLDGWVYATHGYSAGRVKALGLDSQPQTDIGSGVVRFKPDGTAIEMVSSKRGNTWGLTMTADGQCFWTQPTSGTVLFHTVLPESTLARGKIPGTESFKGMITGQKTYPLMSWEQAAYKQIDFVGSYTAASGCAIYEGGAWPERWNRSYFVGEPTINIVSHFFLKKDGVSYAAEKEKGREETEFIRSRDLWFRPIEQRVGPDGALYVIDFYNQAVIHNDTRGPKHGPASAAVRPDRDHYFGRIWKIQHKNAKKLEVNPIINGKPHALETASFSHNAHTRMTAIRLMREKGFSIEMEDGSPAVALCREFKKTDSPEDRQKLISAYEIAKDDWSRSALISVASKNAMEVILDCLKAQKPDALVSLAQNLVPIVLRENPTDGAVKLIHAVAKAPSLVDGIRAAIFSEIIANNKAQPALDKELSDSLSSLLADPTTGSLILPLVTRWDKQGALKDVVGKQIELLSKKLADSKVNLAERIAAARALVSMGTDDSTDKALVILKNPEEPAKLQSVIITSVSEANLSVKLISYFNGLSPDVRNLAFNEIIKRPAAAIALLDGVDTGTIDPKNISPGDVARLRSHPDKGVSAKANAIIEKLMPGAKAKEETIAAFLPIVSKPGDAKNGKMLFTAACAVCHKFGESGADVGPALTGMGSHGAAELLVHIVDPNREVDPSFWQWNITTKTGETLAGVVTGENRVTVNLRNQGGDTEIRKDNIASRENTHRSLMPEGLDALGAENLRDILTYMTEAFSDLPADSTSATGLRFKEPQADGVLRVLIVGAGASHNFPRDFIKADTEILSKIPKTDVIATMNLAEALEAMPKAEALVFSGNHNQWGTAEFQKALNTFADSGKGIILLHAATWSHPWEGYNKRFVDGGTKGHGKGTVTAECVVADHPILKGVSKSFTIEDESYHFTFFDKEGHTTLIENKPDGKSKESHPALWIVEDPKARIVAYTHGHDDKSHANTAYQTLLQNAVKWVSKR